MAGAFKVDFKRGTDDWRRRSSHKTEDDAILQTRRAFKKESDTNIVARICKDGVEIKRITRMDVQ